jgi:hypothetical protein
MCSAKGVGVCSLKIYEKMSALAELFIRQARQVVWFRKRRESPLAKCSAKAVGFEP